MTKTVLITGASGGIGLATAHKFAAEGWNVVATMRNPTDGGTDNVVKLALDVTDSDSITSAVSAAQERFGAIDVLVNNAGYGAFGPLETFTAQQVERQFATNVAGLVAVTQAVLPSMRENQSGTIINVSSLGGLITLPFFSLYHATKWAVEGLSESLTFELAPLGIRVRLVEPGAIATDFSGRSADLGELPVPNEYGEMFEKISAARGAGFRSPVEVVSEVIYAAAIDPSDRLRYPAGPDAEQISAMRAQVGDVGSMAAVRERYGL